MLFTSRLVLSSPETGSGDETFRRSYGYVNAESPLFIFLASSVESCGAFASTESGVRRTSESCPDLSSALDFRPGKKEGGRRNSKLKDEISIGGLSILPEPNQMRIEPKEEYLAMQNLASCQSVFRRRRPRQLWLVTEEMALTSVEWKKAWAWLRTTGVELLEWR
jgi:hypothetical protein